MITKRVWFHRVLAPIAILVTACSGGGNGGAMDLSVPLDQRLADGGLCATAPEAVATANPSPPAPTSDPADLFAGRCGAAPGQIFPPDAPWNQSVRDVCIDPRSAAITAYLDAVVTGSQTFRIDMGSAAEVYGFQPLAADDSIAEYPFTPTGDFFPIACDEANVPVPPTGRLEGESGYDCSGGDCHLTVYDTTECKLFEMWRADDPLGSFTGGCLAVWDTTTTPDDLRGLGCTSADAAGLPIVPLLVTPLQVRTGGIRHALRFILPNDAVQRDRYARPATHNPLTTDRHGEPATGPAGTMPPPYGVRLRLRADFDASALSPAARAMVEALKEYGMIHADGGDVTFIASNDAYSGAAWSDADIALGPNELRDAGLRWQDFDVVSDLDDVESMAANSCARTPLNEF